MYMYFSNGCISLVGRIVKNEIPDSLMFALEIAQAMAVAGEYENSGWPMSNCAALQSSVVKNFHLLEI